MIEKNKLEDKSSHVTSSIAIVAILLSIFAVQETIFKPTRPPMINTERAFSEDARSRLWQDPFQAVEEYRKRYQIQENKQLYVEFDRPNGTSGKLFAEAKESDKNVLIRVPSLDRTHAYEYGKGIMRVCANSEKPKTYPDDKVIANSFEELHCDIREETKNVKKVHVVGVMVPGGPYAEDKERRLRSRYAAISALAETGITTGGKINSYVPKDPEHIQFLDFDKACKALLPRTRSEIIKSNKDSENVDIRVCELRDVMPYEWFKLPPEESNEVPLVLLLWLDNDAFIRSKHPLNLLGYLISKISEVNNNTESPKINLSFSLIGPHGSALLYHMSQEVKDIDLQGKNNANKYYKIIEKNLKMYTATATIEQKELCNFDPHDGCKNLDKEFAKNFLDNTIVRTIGTHESTLKTLTCELALRGINLFPVNSESNKINKYCEQKIVNEIPQFRVKQNHVVFIGEKDNLFSRKLTNTFREFPAANNSDLQNNLHFFNYLRGLDGITSEQSAISQEAKNRNRELQENKSLDIRAQLERPVGASQLDYLLNLADQLKKLDQEIARKGEEGIKAIGITGSDTYDKLLILQALHNKFPGVLFFTTDLDSRLFHPSEIKWTRNLIVASPFGLTFNDFNGHKNARVQDDTPPFRDSFQTSLFLSIRLALCREHQLFEGCIIIDDKNNPPEWTKHPRLFEIGNHGAVDISHTTHRFMPDPELKRLRGLHFRNSDDSGKVELKKKDSEQNQESPKFIVSDILSNTIFFPAAIIILFLSALLSVIFLPKHYRPGVIGYAFLLIALIFGYLFLVAETSNNLGGEPVSFTNGISSWPSNGIKILMILLSFYFIWHINKQLRVSQKETEKRFLLNSNIMNTQK